MEARDLYIILGWLGIDLDVANTAYFQGLIFKNV